MDYTKFTTEQIKVFTNAVQLFEIFENLANEASRFDGSMHWKTIDDRQYLYRGFSGGRNTSLGPRKEQTEAVKQAFTDAKARFREQMKYTREQLRIHSGYVRLNRLNRFPQTAADVVRAFHKAKIPLTIVGTNALYVYETAAGVMFLPEHLATNDADMLLDNRRSFHIAAKLKKRTLLQLLKKADESFEKVSSDIFEFAAANRDGYRVDFITQEKTDLMSPNDFFKTLSPDDLKPQCIGSLKWLVSSPRFSEVVFDQKGAPIRLETVDPRAYLIHKYHVALYERQNALKRNKDLRQVQLMLSLLQSEFPHLTLNPALERLFPNRLIKEQPLK